MKNVAANFPACDKSQPNPENPKCLAKDPPVTARVIKNEVQGGEVTITIAVGSEKGVAQGWTGRVLRGDTDNPLDGGEVHVVHVGKRETAGKVHLTTDQISQNPRGKLSPP